MSDQFVWLEVETKYRDGQVHGEELRGWSTAKDFE